MRRQLGWMLVAAAGWALSTAGPAHAAGLTLRVWTWDGPDGSKPILRALEQFEKEHPGIQTKLESVTADYKPKLLAALAAGTAPDVFMVGDWDYAEFYYNGVLENLTPWLERDQVDLKAYLAPVLAGHRQVDGQYYTMPKDFSTLGVFYNKDHFDEAGLAYPREGWTWAEALEMGKKLTIADASGKVSRYGIFADPEWVAQTLSFAWGAGLSVMDPSFRKFEGYLNNPKAIEAMQFYIDLSAKHRVAPLGWDARNAIGHAEGAFENERASIVLHGNWPINRWKSDKRLRWGTAVPPVYSVQPTTFVMEAGWGMPAGIQNAARKEAAWKLLKFLAGPKGQAHMVAAGWAMPSIPALANELGIVRDPYYGNFFKAAQYTMPTYWTKVPLLWRVMTDRLGDAIRDAMFGRKALSVSVQELTPVAQAELEKVLAEFKRK